MAEAAGLALGVLALAGLFKDCVDLFSLISASRHLGRDYELLDTKLDVEKTLLLQWADRVQLLSERNHDERLNNPETSKAVSRILGSVRVLLSESDNLQHRYGMRPAKQHNQSRTTALTTMSRSRMARFVKEFEELNLRVESHKKGIPLLNNIRWVVHDRDKFDVLINDLSHFISRLNDLVPDSQGRALSMTLEDLDCVRSLKFLKLVLKATAEQETAVASVAERCLDGRCKQQILARLRFQSIDHRESNIVNPHYKTLHWIFESPDGDVEWDDLSDWLRFGSGIYWVSGKAGSGKSTLMKYLYRNEKTRSFLKGWAGSNRLSMADFYFWNFGTIEQKSQEGLGRALLFRVLNEDNSLIPTVLPSMWEEIHNVDEERLVLPSCLQMKEAMDKLGDLQLTNRKFCFFIDGVDEYAGDYSDGISFIEGLVKSPSIKVVVSSRPIPSCVQAFSARSHLQLQDLTRQDIADYVDDCLGKHPDMTSLLEVHTEEAKTVLKDLVDKASGVFLWVVLACKSVLEGLADCDYVHELQRRVDELPPELEKLFQHMLDKIQPRHQEQAAKLLRVCYQRHLLETTDHIATWGLALLDESDMDVYQMPVPTLWSRDQLLAKCKALAGRLRSRCCGLLEVQRTREHCFCQDKSHDRVIDTTVQFIHRSLFEFLNSEGIWNLPSLRIRDPRFDPNAALSSMSAHLARVSCCGNRRLWTTEQQAKVYISDSLIYARHASSSSSEIMTPGIFGLEEAVLQLVAEQQRGGFFDLVEKYSPENKNLALFLAVEVGVVSAVKACENLKDFVSPLKPQRFPLLYHCISPVYSDGFLTRPHIISTEMLGYLFSIGCDPNEKFGIDRSSTPWLEWLSEPQPSIRMLEPARWAEVTEMFLQAGADISGFHGPDRESLENFVERLLMKRRNRTNDDFVITKVAEIRQIIEARRSVGNAPVQKCGDHQTTTSCSRETSTKRPGPIMYDLRSKRLKCYGRENSRCRSE